MKSRIPLLAAALAAAALQADATTVATNLFEGFSNCATVWKNSAGMDFTYSKGWVDNDGWTGSGCYRGTSGLKLGGSGTYGWAQTPTNTPFAHTKSITLTLQAAAYANKTGTIAIEATTASSAVVLSTNVSLQAMSSDTMGPISDSTYSIGPFNVTTTEPFSIKFSRHSGNDGRIAIDSVLIESVILDVISTPANLDLDGVVGANDFAVQWDAVANANGYSVKLLDANAAVVSSNDVQTTSASFSGLTSSSEYTVVVVALGDYDATDDSAAATLTVETAASAVAAPTLEVAQTSWTAGVAGTSAVSATLPGDVACAFASVEMSDGSTATVANGVLSWTPPASATASTVTATFHVTHGTDGWDIEQVLSVAATPAPSAPSISFSNASHRSFDAAWSSSSGGPVSEYKVRAWTGRATPDDATGGASENFAAYLADKTVPDGWIFTTSKNPYQQADNPVDFRNNNEWVASPDFGGTITSVSFRLRRQSESGSTFKVYGSTGSADPDVWKTEENTLATLNPLATQVYTISVDSSKGISRVFFQYTKATGNVSIGSFSVSGVNWPAADFLEGWGGVRVSVGSATSQTFLQPVPGVLNYVEVTAVGPAGATAVSRASVAVPRPAPTKITIW